MPIHKTEAFILAKRDLRETSLLVNFYTRDFGKLSGVLKGIRAEPQKFASSMELFSHNEIVLYWKERSSFHLISQCDTKDNYENIRRDMLKSAAAGVMMELVSGVMPLEDKNEEVFELIRQTLQVLEGNDQTEKLLLIFKIKLLSLSGFEPHFESCVCCGSKISREAKFSLARGGLLCPRCFAKDQHSRTIFRGTIASILHIQRNEFSNTLNLGLNPQIKKELGMILNAFFNFHLEREFQGERVLKQLHSMEVLR
jgi:DNA repair protein RecO (recombination protein O)